jgi:hypothetical protein
VSHINRRRKVINKVGVSSLKLKVTAIVNALKWLTEQLETANLQQNEEPAPMGTVGVPGRFEVRKLNGQTIVSNISSLAAEQVNGCLLTRCVTKEIFPFQKFLILDSELDFGARLQKQICYKLTVTYDVRGYWEHNQEKVRAKLTKKRNNVTKAIRKKMIGKSKSSGVWGSQSWFILMSLFCAALHRRGDMKSLANIKKLRANKDTYYWLMNNFAPLVVGAETFKKQVKKVPPTVWCTASSKAFTVLCLENYYNNAQDIATNSNGIRKPLWTSEGWGARRNQGWSKMATEKFNSYCRLVAANWVKETSKKIDRVPGREKNQKWTRQKKVSRNKKKQGRIEKLVGMWLMLMNGVMKRPQKKCIVQAEKAQRVTGRMNWYKKRRTVAYIKNKTNREPSKEKE